MPQTSSQTSCRELDKKLWISADKKGAQASCLSLGNEKAKEVKDTGKMPVLRYKITSTGKLIDDALEAVEKENPKLKTCGETLFIDARKLSFMKDRLLRDFTKEDVGKIAGTFRAWRASPNSAYADAAGFSKSANLPEIISHGHILPPGRYVGAEDLEDDGEPFEEKMRKLVTELKGQFAESAKLETAIKGNLKGLGYGF